MTEIRETAIDHVAGEDHATFCSSEKKWINYIHKLKNETKPLSHTIYKN